MKNKIKYIVISFSIATIFVGHSIYAQEISPIGKLAQNYIERLTEDLSKTGSLVPGAKQKPVVVNPQAVESDAITESIDTISKTVNELKDEKDKTINQIKDSVKVDIDATITNIRKEKADTPAHELQKVVDEERMVLFDKVSQGINDIKPTKTDDNSKKIEQLKTDIGLSLDKIKDNLEEESGLPANFEKSKRDVGQTLLKFQDVLNQKKEIIESRQGDLSFKDSDGDGISDYDEIYLYKTDPTKAKTKGDGRTDGEKIRDGVDPLSDNEHKIIYQDPREDKESFVSDSYTLDKVELVKEDKKLVFGGKALPNSYVTLYIYSTPIIVTVKTDDSGKWNYQLDKELEDGEHQIYVTSVDNSGKIVARSNPIIFTKSAEAAVIGIAGSVDSSLTTQNFLKDNFILITLGLLIMVVVLGMMFVGNHKTIKSALTELKNQVNSK
ncbi:MAG: hypothetical protein RLY49_568 [Candidatus Parcubacteria bacterium]|jgi:DNA-binding transcriptional MerR regulator